MSSSTAVIVAVAFIILMLVVGLCYSTQENRMKRSKEILDRYNPERSKKPLGL